MNMNPHSFIKCRRGFKFLIERQFGAFQLQNYQTARKYHFKTRESGPLISLKYELDEKNINTGVALLSFNNSSRLNPMSEEMGKQFQKALKELEDDSSVRALVLTGKGRAFSAGGDMEFLKARAIASVTDNERVMQSFYSRFLCVHKMPFPTIAAINGPAMGAGFCVALACDIRLACRQAKMAVNFVRLGLSPGMAGSLSLPRVTNHQIAARMVLTGDTISGEEAVKLGLVAQAYETPADLLEEAIAMARRISAASPQAVTKTLELLRGDRWDGLEKHLESEAKFQAECYQHKDYLEGITSSIEKRSPKFDDHR
mmetsp:Transcript_29360/g.37857  ORF Transcript_29360/g.37857 Transcript_29360/m.37857 type:complete len:314 (-) Transcript_29360:61-1002(-)